MWLDPFRRKHKRIEVCADDRMKDADTLKRKDEKRREKKRGKEKRGEKKRRDTKERKGKSEER